jgi:hypothetical protein
MRSAILLALVFLGDADEWILSPALGYICDSHHGPFDEAVAA